MSMWHNQTIVYVGNFSINNMNAAGKRVYMNAKIMQELGYKVVLIGVDKTDSSSTEISATHNSIDGFEIYHFPGVLFKKSRFNFFAFYAQFENLLDSSNWDIKAIIGYNSPSVAFFVGRVLKYCKRKNIKYITDVADWLIVDSNKLLFRALRQFDINLKNAYYSKKSDGLIAVSSWLAEYYKQSVPHIVIIPPLSNIVHKSLVKRESVPKIVYAGIPFREGNIMKDPSMMKDRFDLVCQILRHVKDEGTKFEFHVYGFKKEEILFSLPFLRDDINGLNEMMIFHGMVPMDVVQEAVSSADYTIIMREKNRMTMAGFPTKVSESISCGTPVITTKTSDIEKYLIEGREVFYLEPFFTIDNCDIVSSLLRRTERERELIKQECCNNRSFSIQEYIEPMKHFLDSVIINSRLK